MKQASKKPKILFLLYSGLGGHANVIFNLIDAGLSDKLEVELLFYGIENIISEYKEKCNQSGITYAYIKKRQGLDFGFYFKIINYISKSSSKIVFLNGSYLVGPALVAKIKTKFQIIVRETQANHLKSRIEKVSSVLSLKYADYTVYLTEEYAGQSREKHSKLYKPEKVRIISNGLKVQKTNNTIPLNNSESRTFTLGMVSRIVPIKDHFTLLIAVSRLKNIDYKLVIAGDGSNLLKLKRAVDNLGIQANVEFVGAITQEQITKLLLSLDVYVHATLGETMSTSIMQAMAAGLPIIASDVDGVNNMIVQNETGFLVPPKEPEAMAQAILKLHRHPMDCKRMGDNAFKYAKANLSREVMLDKYLKILSI